MHTRKAVQSLVIMLRWLCSSTIRESNNTEPNLHHTNVSLLQKTPHNMKWYNRGIVSKNKNFIRYLENFEKVKEQQQKN